jgi:hypothetical protein
MSISSTFRDIINLMNPDAQKTGLGTEIKRLGDLEASTPVIITKDVTASAVGGLAVTIPCNFEILEVVTQCRAANASGTLLLKKGSTAITDAMICAVDKVVTRAGTIDDAQSTLLTTDTLSVFSNGAADRGIVTIIGRRN